MLSVLWMAQACLPSASMAGGEATQPEGTYFAEKATLPEGPLVLESCKSRSADINTII